MNQSTIIVNSVLLLFLYIATNMKVKRVGGGGVGGHP